MPRLAVLRWPLGGLLPVDHICRCCDRAAGQHGVVVGAWVSGRPLAAGGRDGALVVPTWGLCALQILEQFWGVCQHPQSVSLETPWLMPLTVAPAVLAICYLSRR